MLSPALLAPVLSEVDARRSPREVLEAAESELLSLAIEAQRAGWVYATFVNDDTEQLSSLANARLIDATVRHAKAAASVPADRLSPEEARKVRLLRSSLPALAPSRPEESRELTGLIAAMEGVYAKARYQPDGTGAPVDLQGLSRILRERREPALLEDVWSGWQRVGRPMRNGFSRYVELANRGAREVGFEDNGAMWRSKYDLEPEAFEREVERLWTEVRPLYRSLYRFVRGRLRALYGNRVVPETGPVPCHLFGNMWAQSWDALFPLVFPSGPADAFDLGRVLEERKIGAVEMVRYGERFFDSLGFDKLPATFWERSMFERPRDREVVCHASAWDVDLLSDLRIKMCIEPTADDFQTIHHELGHNYYQRACRHLPYLYRDGAHDGFHEAIGDAVALSVTPRYLTKVGLRQDGGEEAASFPYLFSQALDKLPFLPFGLLVDRWRWKVFSGEVGPEAYNRSWWELRETYQGMGPPKPRGEEEFDPGGKYHVPANVPYVRYFLSVILQFQFHRAFLRTAGYRGPPHLGSIYGSAEAGARLRSMLELGASRPWPDALEAGTGERRMDAGALLEYFAPVHRWLDDQNRRSAAA